MLQITEYFTEYENRGVVGTQVCPNHKHDMGKLYFIQLKKFYEIKLRCWRGETKRRKQNSTYT